MRALGTVALVAALAVAGCGSSSSSSGSGTTTTARAANRAQVADCLRKQGVTLPSRQPGAPPPQGAGGGGFLFGDGAQGQPRQADPKFQAAAKKCGLSVARRQPGSNPRFKQAIQSFVTCVRKNGYDMPAPNLSGSGPVFDASKVNRNDPKFRKAAQACQSLLNFGRPPAGSNS